MAKTQEELNKLKVEYETLNNKLKELTDDELKEVTGGILWNSPRELRCAIYMGNAIAMLKECPSIAKGKTTDCNICPLNQENDEIEPRIRP